MINNNSTNVTKCQAKTGGINLEKYRLSINEKKGKRKRIELFLKEKQKNQTIFIPFLFPAETPPSSSLSRQPCPPMLVTGAANKASTAGGSPKN